MDDLVKRLRRGVRRLDCKPADNTKAERDLAIEAADIIEEQAALLREAGEVALHVTAHLATAVSLLERSAKVPKDGRAPSDTMFNRTLEDQKSAIDRARAFITKLEARK